MKYSINRMMIFIEPDCTSCERVVETATTLYRYGFLRDLVVINRTNKPEVCAEFGVMIYPTVYINGKLAFYGEFTIEDAIKYAKQVVL